MLRAMIRISVNVACAALGLTLRIHCHTPKRNKL
jgi:hypothetical protein